MVQKDIVLLALYLLLWLLVLVTRRRQLIKPMLLAAALAAVWTLLAQQQYGYNTTMTTGFGFNLFPLVGWALGLSVTFLLFSVSARSVQPKTWWQKLVLTNLFYLPLLILVETIAYHSLNVVNLATAQFQGLPICDCIHAPLWMQAAYLSMGTVYMSLVIILKLDQPPQVIQKSASSHIANAS